jgi:hypothetical protein
LICQDSEPVPRLGLVALTSVDETILVLQGQV